MFEVQLILKCELGDYEGETFVIKEESFEKVLEKSRTYYSKNGFELKLKDGDYVIFSPEIVQKSVLIIRNKKIEEEDVQE